LFVRGETRHERFAARELADDLGITCIEVTLDGTARFHDARRNYKSGAPSFDRILRNVVDVARSDVSVGVVVRCNVDRGNAASFAALLDLFASLGLQDRISIYAAKVHSWGNDAHLTSYTSAEFAALESEWLARQVRLGYRLGLLPQRKPIVCLATRRDAELVDAHGTLFDCTEVSYVPTYGTPNRWAIGDIHSGTDVRRSELGDFNSRVRRSEVPCTSCRMLPVCGGSCPKAWLEGNEEPCPPAKYNLAEKLMIEFARDRIVPVRPPVLAFDDAVAAADRAAGAPGPVAAMGGSVTIALTRKVKQEAY
jgi:uncharacterized protein